MRPCVQCDDLTGALAWFLRKGGEQFVPLCPACFNLLDSNPAPVPNNSEPAWTYER